MSSDRVARCPLRNFYLPHTNMLCVYGLFTSLSRTHYFSFSRFPFCAENPGSSVKQPCRCSEMRRREGNVSCWLELTCSFEGAFSRIGKIFRKDYILYFPILIALYTHSSRINDFLFRIFLPRSCNVIAILCALLVILTVYCFLHTLSSFASCIAPFKL